MNGGQTLRGPDGKMVHVLRAVEYEYGEAKPQQWSSSSMRVGVGPNSERASLQIKIQCKTQLYTRVSSAGWVLRAVDQYTSRAQVQYNTQLWSTVRFSSTKVQRAVDNHIFQSTGTVQHTTRTVEHGIQKYGEA